MEVRTSFHCRSTLRLSQMYPSLMFLKRKLVLRAVACPSVLNRIAIMSNNNVILCNRSSGVLALILSIQRIQASMNVLYSMQASLLCMAV